jgi:hypothetical protein
MTPQIIRVEGQRHRLGRLGDQLGTATAPLVAVDLIVCDNIPDIAIIVSIGVQTGPPIGAQKGL